MDGNGNRAWNSTLRRRAPAKWKSHEIPRKTPLKRTKAMKAQSDKAKVRHAEYMPVQNRVVAEWRERGERCAICRVRGITPPNLASEIHHLYGRAGSLLTDERGMVPSCFPCRTWPHDNPNTARRLGVLGERWQWGVPIDEHEQKRP